jgi:hypothetical protein
MPMKKLVRRMARYLYRTSIRCICVVAAVAPLSTGLAANTDGSVVTPASTGNPLDAQAAIVQLYGGKTWSDGRLEKYFHSGQPTVQPKHLAFISVAFQAGYSEDGVEKSVVITKLTPQPEAEFSCHACTPIIGGAVFAFHDNRWDIESQAQILGSGTGANNDFSLVKIGPDRYGVLYRLEDIHQGYEQKRLKIIAPIHGALVIALAVGFDESPGEGACADAQPQSVTLNVLRSSHGSDPGFFDVLTAVLHNEGICGHLVFRRDITRYVFKNGGYADINTIPVKSEPAQAMEFGIYFGAAASRYDLCANKGFVPRGAQSAEELAESMLKTMEERTRDTEGTLNVRKGWDLAKQQIAQRSADYTQTRCQEVAAQWAKCRAMLHAESR